MKISIGHSVNEMRKIGCGNHYHEDGGGDADFSVFVIFSLIRSNLTFMWTSMLIFLSHLSIVVAVAPFAFITSVCLNAKRWISFLRLSVCIFIAFLCENVVDDVVAHAMQHECVSEFFSIVFSWQINEIQWKQQMTATRSGNRHTLTDNRFCVRVYCLHKCKVLAAGELQCAHRSRATLIMIIKEWTSMVVVVFAALRNMYRYN